MFNLFAVFGSIKVESTTAKSKGEVDRTVYNYSNEFAGEGIVDEAIAGPYNKGRVYFDCTWWPAKCDRPVVLLPGQVVRVLGIQGITLIVEPVN